MGEGIIFALMQDHTHGCSNIYLSCNILEEICVGDCMKVLEWSTDIFYD